MALCSLRTTRRLGVLVVMLIVFVVSVCLRSLAQGVPATKEIVIGNQLLSRVLQTESGGTYTKLLRSRGEVPVASREFEIVCEVEGREIVLDGRNTSARGFTSPPSGTEGTLAWQADQARLEVRAHFRADASRPFMFKQLEVTNRGARPVRLLKVTVDELEMKGGVEPLRGGVGQPILLGNDFFLGVEHPAAANEIFGEDIRLAHFPQAEVAPGQTWVSHRAVLGAAVGDDEPVEEAFRNYLVAVTGRTPKTRPIYCDWAAHDELGTLVKPQLTEQLVDSQLDILKSLQADGRSPFSYYLMDAFWYDPTDAYLDFKKPNWPRGYGPALERMLGLGMKPGLWFDLGGSTLALKLTPGWRGPEHPCLPDLPFQQLLEHAMEFHIREHSLALLKFDFTKLLCQHDDDAALSLAILERNADALREICERVRELNPELVIRAYNEFSSVEMMSSTKRWDEAYAVSPWWLFWFDSVYSGDPRPADLPSVTSLRDSVNWYQDHVYRGYFRSLMPAFAIDDCGTLVGKTSTIYYLGAEGFTDSWLLNILRGGPMPTFYGDLSLLTARDRNFLTASLRFLREHEKLLESTRPILGVPGKGEVYGYLARESGLTLVTLVNPGLYSQTFALTVPDSPPGASQKLLFSNVPLVRPMTSSGTGRLQGSLVPGEIRVYGLGPRATLERLSLPAAPTRRYHEAVLEADPFRGSKEAQLRMPAQRVGATLAVIVRYWRGGEADRNYDRPQEVMKLTGEVASAPVSFSTVPRAGTDIWSRCSWAVFEHRIAPSEAGKVLKLHWVGSPPSGTTWTVTTLWLR